MHSVETADAAMTTPGGFEDAPLAKRNGYRGMMPGSWTGRAVRIEYVDAAGQPVRGTGILLDYFGFGVALSLAGARVLLSWDRVILIELQPGD